MTLRIAMASRLGHRNVTHRLIGHVRGVHGDDNFRVASGVTVILSGGSGASSTVGRCGACVYGRILTGSLALTSRIISNARLGFSSFSLCMGMAGLWCRLVRPTLIK